MPHPSDYQTLFLFLVGGISIQEIHDLQQIALLRGIRLIIGSTHIGQTDEVLRHLFKTNP